MAEYRYVKKFVITDKEEFWQAALWLGSGILCIIGLLIYFVHMQNDGERMRTVQFVPMVIMAIFNTLNGVIRFDRKELYKWQKKRVHKTAAEKLMED